MNRTVRFQNAIRFAAVFVAIMFVYSFLLSYNGMSGISISHPDENSTLRILLNEAQGLLRNLAFWMLVGYIFKDYMAAISALIISILLGYVFNHFYPISYVSNPPKDVEYYIRLFIGALPSLVFGMVHFRSFKGLKMVLVWAILWGFSISLNSNSFERFISGLTWFVGVGDPFEIHVATGESSYRPVRILEVLKSELYLIVQLFVFWWVYRFIESKQNVWRFMNTIPATIGGNKLYFSIVYWSFRLLLFIAAFGLVSHVANTFRLPLDVFTVGRILMCGVALIIITSIYRNFLVSHFVERNQFPGGLYFVLNIPIINVFAWIYVMLNFDKQKMRLEVVNKPGFFENIKEKFVKEYRNNHLKIIIMILVGLSMIPQFKGGENAFIMLVISVFSFALMIWFLYNEEATIILLLISILALGIISALRIESLLYPAMASGIINIILFYGLFYFDEFRREEYSFDEEKDRA